MSGNLKVVPIGKHPKAKASQRECVAALESALERVRAGEIEGLAIVMVRHDGRTLIERTEIDHVDALLGGTLRLQREVMKASEDAD